MLFSARPCVGSPRKKIGTSPEARVSANVIARQKRRKKANGRRMGTRPDATGRRRGKTIGGTTTNFLYDGLNLVQELTSGGTPTANLLTGLGIDETFSRAEASGTSTLLSDALGSTLALASVSGTV